MELVLLQQLPPLLGRLLLGQVVESDPKNLSFQIVSPPRVMIGDAQENQAAVTFGILPWRRQKVYEKTKALAYSNIYLLRGGVKKVTIWLQKQGGTNDGPTME